MAPTAMEQAESALHRAEMDSGSAAPLARDAVRRAGREGDLAALSVAEQAWGRALLQTRAVTSAIAHLERAVAAAGQAGADERAAEARVALGAALAQRGRTAQALAELDLATATAGPAGRARALAQRADVRHQSGRVDGLEESYDEAVGLLRATGDRLYLGRCLVNRGILHTERHRFPAAERDLLEADEIAADLGRDLARGIIAENLGYLATLRGDVPTALARLTHAREVIGGLGGPVGFTDLDRAELLLSVGAASEARAVAALAAADFTRERRGLMVPLARLTAAQCGLLEGDHLGAAEDAAAAHRLFRRQRRPEFAALARLAGLEAGLGSATAIGSTPVTGRALREMAEDLARAQWPLAAIRSRVVAARLLEARGHHQEADQLLDEAASARHRGTAAVRAQGWNALARLRSRAGDRVGSRKAARAGLRVLDDHATSLGASDLRAYSSIHRRELAGLGLADVVAHGSAGDLLRWSEHARANRLTRRAVVPPEDAELADLLEQMRGTLREPATERREQTVSRLERRIRDRVRLLPAVAEAGPPPMPSVRELGELLGDTVLLSFVEQGGTLHAVSVDGSRAARREVGSVNLVRNLVERLTFALRRLNRPAAPGSREAARALLEDTADTVDRLLLGEASGRPLVVVPTGPLHHLPWAVLPSLAGRPVSVTPSVRLWCTPPPEARPGVLVVAGPGLAGAEAEAEAVAALHHDVRLLTGDQATAGEVLERVDGVGLLHLAAHGRLASPNPLFSSLRLADGPLVGYDFERSTRLPATVVLASCDSGRVAVHSGDALLGLGASFMARGTSHLVAPVVPVWDLETVSVMVCLHAGLAAGRTAAEALATAQREVADGGARHRAAAAGFVCVATRLAQ